MYSEPLVGIITGEILDEEKYVVVSKDALQNRKKYYEDKKQKETKYQHSKLESKEYGNFVWVLFNYVEELFPDFDLATITRIFMLSTFVNYDGYLSFDNGNIITKKKLIGLLNLNKKTFDAFYRKIKNSGIIFEEEEKIFVNNDYFMKGNLNKNITQNNQCIRMYINIIRELYVKTDISSHKHLGYLFKLIPYISCQFNFICKNPLAPDSDCMQKMDFGEICDILKYSRKNINRLFDIFSQIKTKNNKPVVSFITYGMNKNDWNMFVNPNVFYAGNDWYTVKVLRKTFGN